MREVRKGFISDRIREIYLLLFKKKYTGFSSSEVIELC